MYKIIYSPDAVRDLDELDRVLRTRILKKLAWFAVQNDPLAFAKKLEGQWGAAYRFRVGDYRIIFEVGKLGKIQILSIIRVQHRKEVYGL